MWRLLYNCLLIPAAPVVIGVLLAKQRCRRGLPERLGLEAGLSGLFGLSRLSRRPSKPDRPDRPVIWVHAVSLGEVVAAAPLVKALQGRHPEYHFIVTTVTETGREAVEQRLAGIAEHRYAPLDFPWVVSGMIERLRPALYLFVETELWPNLLWELRARQVPAVLVNGRLSSRSFRRQNVGVIRSFYRSVLRSLTLCLMQSDRDRERIVALGADPARVHTTGNIKFDQPLPEPQVGGSLRAGLGVGPQEQLILAGSTHAGEEEVLVSAYGRLLHAHPSAVLMLAPRHVERADRVAAMVRESGFAVQRKSQLRAVAAGPRVIILDTRGELARAYQEADAAFVGGTLVPVGGHNLLEPAVWATPVTFGPYTDHCAEVATLLHESGGGRRIASVEDLVRTLDEWLTDRAGRDRVGQVARRVVLDNQGALTRSLELIDACLNSAPPRTDRSVETAGGPAMARP
jgi:3-deoxy-D-manno-octulosonic-acid transferase